MDGDQERWGKDFVYQMGVVIIFLIVVILAI